MIKRILHLARTSLGYLAANVASVLLGVLLLPVFTRYLSTDEYGIVSIAATVTAFLSIFLQLGQVAAYTRFYFDHRENAVDLKRHVSTTSIFLAVYGLVLTTLITLFGKPVEAITPDVPFSPYLQMAAWSAYFSMLCQLILRLYQAEQQSGRYAIFFTANVVTTVLLNVVLVVVLKKGAQGYVMGGLISNGIFALISLWLLRHHLVPHVDTAKLRASLRYGLPLIPHMLGAWMFNLADRILINKLVSIEEAGLYSVGYQIGMGMNIVSTAISYAWSPFFFSQVKEKGEAAKGELAKITTYWVLVMCLIFLLISLFCREVIGLLRPDYHQAYHVVPLVAGGYLCMGLYFVTGTSLFWLGKTRHVAAVTISSGLLNIGLNFLLIPHMQMMGSALATLLACAFQFIVIAALAHKWFPLPYEYGRLSKIVVATAVCYLGAFFTSSYFSFWPHFGVKLGLVVLFPILLVLLSFPTRDEWKTLARAPTVAITLVKTAPGRFRRGGR